MFSVTPHTLNVSPSKFADSEKLLTTKSAQHLGICVRCCCEVDLVSPVMLYCSLYIKDDIYPWKHAWDFTMFSADEVVQVSFPLFLDVLLCRWKLAPYASRQGGGLVFKGRNADEILLQNPFS
jgi:hypothetical protein